jgi:hypothetical protein
VNSEDKPDILSRIQPADDYDDLSVPSCWKIVPDIGSDAKKFKSDLVNFCPMVR